MLSDLDTCLPKDNDGCLQTSPEWDNSYTCSSSIEYCETYGRDMRRCCPESCGTGAFTAKECNSFVGKGTCKYPNEAQCLYGNYLLAFLIFQ